MEHERATLPSPAELKSAIQTAGLTQQAVADAAGMPKSNLSAALSGHSYLGHKRAAKIMDALHDLMREIVAERATEAAETINRNLPTFAGASEQTPESDVPDKTPRIRRL